VPNRHHVSLNYEGFGSGNAVTAANLRKLFDCSHSAINLQLTAGNRQPDQDADGNAELRGIQRGMVTGDNAGFLQSMNALGDGRSRKANCSAKFRKGLPGITLKRFQDFPGDRVQLDTFGAVLWAIRRSSLSCPPIMLKFVKFRYQFFFEIPFSMPVREAYLYA